MWQEPNFMLQIALETPFTFCGGKHDQDLLLQTNKLLPAQRNPANLGIQLDAT